MIFSPFLEHLFFRRPRALNLLHWLRVVNATSQTEPIELAALERYATGAGLALEIGTYQGVSAARIARSLANGGALYCVDPWPESNGHANGCFSICHRHLERCRVVDRVRILRGYSGKVADLIPDGLDFVFVDGDHSFSGIETDWEIVKEKTRSGGIVCLHDSVVPAEQQWRRLDSCLYFDEVIQRDRRFEVLEVVHTLAILRKK